MRFGALATLAGLIGSLPALAYRVAIKDTDNFREVCSGMFGGDKAFIEVAFESHANGQVALVMYEWHDSEYLGKDPPDDGSYHPKTYICTTTTARAGLCTTEQLGTFLTSLPEGKTLNETTIYTTALRFDPESQAVAGTGGDAPAPTAVVEAEEGKGDSKNTRRGPARLSRAGAPIGDDPDSDPYGGVSDEILNPDMGQGGASHGSAARASPQGEGVAVDNPAAGDADTGSAVDKPAEGSADSGSAVDTPAKGSHGAVQGGSSGSDSVDDAEPLANTGGAIKPSPTSPDGVEIGTNVPVYSKPIRLDVPKTGYYCVGVIPVTLVTNDRRELEERKSVHAEYEGIVTFRNQFDGELPAVEYPKIAFYGVIAIVYVLLAVGWGILCAKHYQELLPMQYYISGTIVFLVIEMIALFTYYRYINKHGGGAGAVAFLMVISVLNAARNSLSFFLLLIVAMGLSVVTPSLGPVMNRVWLLTGFHFVFGVMYSVGTVKVELDSANLILVLLLIFPLSFTLTAFLMWIIVSLNGTILHLQQRKQNFKLAMFQGLYRILVIAVIAVAAFFVLSSISLSNRMDEDYAPRNWRWRWILLDASLSLIYLAVFVAIAWLWRPTENNVRFAMSQELAQDEDDAEDYELDPHEHEHEHEHTGGIALEQPDGREYVHGERPVEHRDDERERLFPSGDGRAVRKDSSGSDNNGYHAPHTNDDNVVFAMGDDSDTDSDAESGKLLTRVSLNSSRGGSRRNSQNFGKYKDKAD